jgi:lipopolysaccharide cholinephosphotransferase
MNQEMLNQLHKIEIEILDEVVRICEKHSLSYFLIGGTLLGAIRHKGFIPWDDDIDIGMPRSDYNKFVKICKTELGSDYYLQSSETDITFWLRFAKIHKNNTVFIDNYNFLVKEKDHTGIFIDIFPYDYTVKNTNIQKIQSAIIHKIETFIWIKRGNQTNKKFFIKLLSKLTPYKTLHFVQNFIMFFFGKRSPCMTNWCNNETSPSDFIKNLIKVEFEKKMYNAFNQYDSYLTQTYGNYMQLPPIEDRQTHTPSKISFDTNQDKKLETNFLDNNLK